MPDEELDEAVRYEAIERFQSLGDEPEVRYYNAGKVSTGQGDQFELVVIGVPGDAIRAQLEAFGRLGLRCAALDLGPAATFRPFERFLRRQEDGEQVNAFLDIGEAGSRLVISRGPEIAFVKVFDEGVAHFTACLRKRFGVDAGEARRLYEFWARGSSVEQQPRAEEQERGAVLDALVPEVERLAKEVSLCLRYFSVTFRGQRPAGVTCVGGGAHGAALLSLLGGGVGVPARLGHAMRNINTERVFSGSDRRTGQPEWATAIGLAMKHLDRVHQDRRRGAVVAA